MRDAAEERAGGDERGEGGGSGMSWSRERVLRGTVSRTRVCGADDEGAREGVGEVAAESRREVELHCAVFGYWEGGWIARAIGCVGGDEVLTLLE